MPGSAPLALVQGVPKPATHWEVPLLTEDLSDLHGFDPALLTWKDLSKPNAGKAPSPRDSFGFAAAGGKIYVHGGENINGECLLLVALSAELSECQIWPRSDCAGSV